jgi:uncharacterized membrane protein (Fun14 family)
VPGEPKTPEATPAEEKPEEHPVGEAFPVVTEASFFALIGFALGYATQKMLKLGLILLAFFFLAIQGLSYAGVLQVDWGRALELVNDLVMNLKGNQTFEEIVKEGIPSAGALVAGYLLGFRKG